MKRQRLKLQVLAAPIFIFMQGHYTYYIYEVHTTYQLTFFENFSGKRKIENRCDNYSSYTFRGNYSRAETIQGRNY